MNAATTQSQSVLDALADAETLRLFVYRFHREVRYRMGSDRQTVVYEIRDGKYREPFLRGGELARDLRRVGDGLDYQNLDIPTRQGAYVARAAFKAVPGLRSS